MAAERSRRWTDRDGTEWEVVYNPSVELDTRAARAFRERIVFRGPDLSFHAPAAYGSDLEALSDGDLQGMLDGAREEQEADHSPWERVREAGEGDTGE